ncbi:hypothetical protein BU14_2051s0001 [Porphyra umbilicalis]|uniref:Cytochrome b5 heme-binding domain-containing protein n=1 Tax=Porphyra umbilicalis TaxID=2786 RepID=A0A1X6NK59_PORUM|nr:hypothetical protein BU14_2051s0001 [Porphyra umbilicalis]|eukprot:OSX68952.1 hypothetical protein BU14_2051s0001 [Porphyra umbilicalis]
MELSALTSGALLPAIVVAAIAIAAFLYIRSLSTIPMPPPGGHGANGGMPGGGGHAARAPPPPPPRYPGVVTESELADATGAPGANLYVAVASPFAVPPGGTREVTVFDMAAGGGSDFYGPDGPYAVFAAVDATRGLAKSSMDAADVLVGGVDGLTDAEMDTLTGWYTKYQSKYPVVGRLVGDDYRPPAEGSAEDKKDA